MPLHYRYGGRWYKASTQGSTSAPPTPPTNQLPTAPTGLGAVAASRSLALSWNPATDPDGTVVAYQVLVGGVITQTVSSTSATLSSLTPSTAYAITVKAVDNTSAVGPASSVLNVSTLADSTPPSTVSHGFYINPANTGYTAYLDSGLGRTLTLADLTAHSSLVNASSLTSSGGTISKHDFALNGINIDIPCTLVACRLSGNVQSPGNVASDFVMNWCTVSDFDGTVGDYGVGYDSYTLYRCNIGGNSDGIKAGGHCVVTECYIRTKGQSSADHNDGMQDSFGNGNVDIIRCNIDPRPVNNLGGANGALFAADSSVGVQTWTDNFLAGGGYVLRMNESCTYVVNGNWILNGSWAYDTYNHTNTALTSITWANLRPNLVVDATGATVSTIALV